MSWQAVGSGCLLSPFFCNVISGISLHVISVSLTPRPSPLQPPPPRTKTSTQGYSVFSAILTVHACAPSHGRAPRPLMPLGPRSNSCSNEAQGAWVQNGIVFENNWWGARCVTVMSQTRAVRGNISYDDARLDASIIQFCSRLRSPHWGNVHVCAFSCLHVWRARRRFTPHFLCCLVCVCVCVRTQRFTCRSN